MSGRRFAVIGLGSFGRHLTRALYAYGHDVLVIDRDPASLEPIAGQCSKAVVSDVTDKEALRASGAADADVAIVCVGDEVGRSVLATLHLKELGVPEILVKAVSTDHGRILEQIGASEIIQPGRSEARRLARQLIEPGFVDELPFLEGFFLTELRVPHTLAGKTLAEAQLRHEFGVAVVLIRRAADKGEEAVLPTAQERLCEGDTVVVLGRPEDVSRLRAAAG